MAKKISKNMTVKDYERLGRSLESIFESGYVDSKRVYKINLIRGLFFGIGSAIGATVILTFLIWFLSFFTELPLIGEAAETIRNTLETTNPEEL